MSSTTVDRLYDVISDRQITGFPTSDDLSDTISALGAIEEFLVTGIIQGVVDKVEDSAQPRLTDEQVGHLLIWCDHMASQANHIRNQIEKIAIAVHESWHTDGLPFSNYGVVRSPESYERLRRGLTFDA